MTRAKIRVAHKGDASLIPQLQKWIADLFYSELKAPQKDEVTFEFETNKIFAEYVLNKKLNYSIPNLNLNDNCKFEVLEQPYICICPGSASRCKRWDDKYFAILCQYIYNKYNIHSILLGSASERIIGDKIINSVGTKCAINLIGNNTLLQSLWLVSQCVAVISNESVMVHAAAALNKPALCISNGEE